MESPFSRSIHYHQAVLFLGFYDNGLGHAVTQPLFFIRAPDEPAALGGLSIMDNMIYARGLDKFARNSAKSGITGMIVPDLPPEEAAPLQEACTRYEVLQDTRDLIARVPGKKPKAMGFGISTPEQAAEVIRAGAERQPSWSPSAWT
jgi:tryptophan synthase alpha subunit